MPRVPRKKMLSLDSETTGLDLRHGARPFLVTFCDEDGVNTWWEWDVDPLTRKVNAPVDDLLAINDLLVSAGTLVLQNAKFDHTALELLFGDYGVRLAWDWGKVQDTLLAGHLLASNHPHDLTNMAMEYLAADVQPYEDRMEAAVKEAKKWATIYRRHWMLAKAGLSEMPSAKDGGKDKRGVKKDPVWKYDCWLPRAVAIDEKYPKDHPWRTVTAEYANSDSTTTLALWQVQKGLIEERQLGKIYAERLRLLPVIAAVERRGMTCSRSRFDELKSKLAEEADECHRKCLSLADHEIEALPINGCSNALKRVLFEKFELVSPKMTPTGQPSTDKYVLDEWIATLPPRSKQLTFVTSLRAYRRRKTALGYLDSYLKYWLPTDDPDTMVIYSSLNPTGTDTLRFSSEYPNSQQISKQDDVNLRYIFGPKPGRVWYSMDASNIELRIPAYEAGEQSMIDLFEHPDDPPYFGSNHLLFFDILHPDKFRMPVCPACLGDGCEGECQPKVPICSIKGAIKKKWSSTWYAWTKNGDFAIQYGAVAESGTADRAYHVPGGQKKIESHLSRVKQLSQRMITLAGEQGYVETMPDKTVDQKRGYPLLCTRSKWGGVTPTVPLSYHVQGTACWWMARAMVRCQTYLDTYNRNVESDQQIYIIAQIHDELVFDFPDDDMADQMAKNLNRQMVRGGDDIGVPTPVNIERHPVCWADGDEINA